MGYTGIPARYSCSRCDAYTHTHTRHVTRISSCCTMPRSSWLSKRTKRTQRDSTHFSVERLFPFAGLWQEGPSVDAGIALGCGLQDSGHKNFPAVTERERRLCNDCHARTSVLRLEELTSSANIIRASAAALCLSFLIVC